MRVVLAVLILVAVGASGCKRGFTAPKADPEKSREILRQGLDAWKKGETPDSLKSSASITFKDPEWDKGTKLTDYKVQGDGQAFGHDWECKVKLSLQNSKGDKSEKTATYDMSTSPSLSVTRNMSR